MSAIATLRSFWLPRASRLRPVATGLTVVGFCLAAMVMLYDMRTETRARAVTAEVNLLNALSQDIARNIELYNLSLTAVVDGLAEPGFAGLSPRMQDLMLYDRAATASHLGAILVLNATGRVVRSSKSGFLGAELADHDYFQALKSDPDLGLFVSKPFRGRAIGDDDVLALARVLRGPDGAFAGVVVGTLRLSYFRDLFAKADLGPRGAITLFRLDGTRVMRAPYDPGLVGRSLAGTPNFALLSSKASGTFDAESTVDGVRRIHSFTRVGRLPLILNVALAEDDVLAQWRNKAAVIGMALLLLCAVAATLARMGARSEADHRLLADNAIDVVMRWDQSRRCTYVSASSRAVLGYAPSELVGRSQRDIVDPQDRPVAEAWMHDLRAGSADGEAVFRVCRKDGTTLWVEGRSRALPAGAGFMTVLRDISDRRAAEEHAAALTAELARLAHSDGLTGLANRRSFDAKLAAEWERAAADASPLSLLLLDVDRFKAFNDRYGHLKGDACLRAVARAVEAAMTSPDATVARYGGEEIAVVLPRTDATAAAATAERVRAAVERLAVPHDGSHEGVVTVSVGCATAEAVSESVADRHALTALADARLYEAKRLGRNRVAAAQSAPVRGARSPGEEARLAALAACEREGRLVPSKSFDQIARLAAHLFGAPGAFVSVVRRDEVVFAGRHGVAQGSNPRDEVFCASTVLGGAPLVVPDAAADPRFSDMPLVRQGCRFYAGAPFMDPVTGSTLGALCIVDDVPRPAFDKAQRDVLAGLALLVTKELRRAAAVETRDGLGAGPRAA